MSFLARVVMMPLSNIEETEIPKSFCLCLNVVQYTLLLMMQKFRCVPNLAGKVLGSYLLIKGLMMVLVIRLMKTD